MAEKKQAKKHNYDKQDLPEDLFPESPKQLIRKYWIMIIVAIFIFLIIALITYFVAR